jgi:uncharacterized protein YigA (DUF484 family)
MRRDVELTNKQLEETRSQVTDTQLKLAKFMQQAEEDSAKQKLKIDELQKDLDKVKALYDAAKTEIVSLKSGSLLSCLPLELQIHVVTNLRVLL